MSVFETLNAVNVNGHTEQKNGLTYLSWAWAWAELLKKYPDSTYMVYENKDGWCYHTDGKTAWVKTGVTVEGKEYIEMLPVMDFRNRSIPVDNITSMDVNKAIQRSLTKAVARHGLGLYIYAGEDLPEDAIKTEPEDAFKPGEKIEVQKKDWSAREAIKKWCDHMGIKGEKFHACRKALIAGGVVPDKSYDDLDPVDLANLCEAITANYPDIVKVSA